ncbi:unnamed protein product, partial [Mesorhabditis belari]|uniref:Amidase domain-containing protein n=1 Tax=Mesorhabditis belari TaxID=2138241 RepID=A0AAF3FJQ5_9BILA
MITWLNFEQTCRSKSNVLVKVNPIINAVVELYKEKALQKAEEVDEYLEKCDQNELNQLEFSKPLLGIPFTCKDMFDVKDTKTTLGNWWKKENVSTTTHLVIRRMIDAGAILIAKTTTSEDCMWIESSNPLNGTTGNPYDTRKNAGGSSGGEGALIAAAGSLLGIGSDFAGSIRIPAALNGVYGLKTTSGVLPLSEFLDNPVESKMAVFGPITRFPEDLNLVLKLFTKELSNQNRRVKTIHIPTFARVPWMEHYSIEAQESSRSIVTILQKAFNANISYINLSKIQSKYIDILVAYFNDYPLKNKNRKATLAGFYEEHEKFHWITEIPKWFTGKSRHSLGSIFDYHALDRMYDDEKKNELITCVSEFRADFDQILGEDSIIVHPTWPRGAAFHHGEIPYFNYIHTGIYNILNLPVVALPYGVDNEGMPLSVSIIGPNGSDGWLVELAEMIEREKEAHK